MIGWSRSFSEGHRTPIRWLWLGLVTASHNFLGTATAVKDASTSTPFNFSFLVYLETDLHHGLMFLLATPHLAVPLYRTFFKKFFISLFLPASQRPELTYPLPILSNTVYITTYTYSELDQVQMISNSFPSHLSSPQVLSTKKKNGLTFKKQINKSLPLK